MSENTENLQKGVHSDDGVWETVQRALEHECEKLDLDEKDYEWCVIITETKK